MKRRIAAILLAAALVFNTAPEFGLPVSAEEGPNGVCGRTLFWALDTEAGVLTITGSGAMYDWEAPEEVPWHNYRALIRAVTLPQGLTGIGSYAFADCVNLGEATIPDSAQSAPDSSAQPRRKGTAGTSVTVTAGMLVADNYDSLSEEERAVLRSAYVLGQSYAYTEPAAVPVEIDTNAHTISAQPYIDGDFVWHPITARVCFDGGEETVSLTEGVGVFTCAANRYSVQVDYSLDIPVDAQLQELLLNGPYRVAKSLENLDAFSLSNARFISIADSIHLLNTLADGIVHNGETVALENVDTVAAIRRLYQQQQTGGALEICGLIEAYDDAYFDDGKSLTQFLFAHGEEFRTVGQQIYTDLVQISSDSQIDSMIGWLPTSSEISEARRLIRTIRNAITRLSGAAEDDWAALTHNPLKNDLTTEEYLSLDALLAAVYPDAPHEDTLLPVLYAKTVVFEYEISMSNVEVTIDAGVIDANTVDSAELTPLETFRVTLRLPDGTAKEELLLAIAACGIEQTALAGWGCIQPEHYERSASDTALPDVLQGDTAYSVVYTPRLCTLSSSFGLTPVQVPYGYNLTLPVHEGTELVYDYEIDGQTWLQGTVYPVRDDVTVLRTENKPWEELRLNSLVADNCTDELTAEELAVLRSEALRSEVLLLRRPDAQDAPVSFDQHGTECVVTARDYPSGIPGLLWSADCAKVYDSVGNELEQLVFTDGTAILRAADAARVSVDYSLAVSTVEPQQVLALLCLPGVLADEAEEQKRMLEIPNSEYDRLGDLDRTTLNRIKIGIRGSDMGDEAKAAAEEILAVCVDDETARLYLYDFLTGYRENGLSYYYKNGNWMRIQEQITVLKRNLSLIFNDPGFIQMLIDIEYEDKYDDIAELIDKLEQAEMSVPNHAILQEHPQMPALVEMIEAAQGHVAEHAPADRPLTISETVVLPMPQTAEITLTVRQRSSAGTELGAASEAVQIFTGKPLTAETVSLLRSRLAALVEQLGVDTAHYTAEDPQLPEQGDVLNGDFTVELIYLPKQYTVRFVEDGTELSAAVIPFDAPVLVLEASGQRRVEYVYTVFEEQISVTDEAKLYTLTTAQIDSLDEQPLVVTRRTIILPPDDADGVGVDAFRGCSGLARVTILNPQYRIADTAATLGAAGVTTIYGFIGSTAQAYAEAYGYEFVPLVTTVDAQGYTGVYDGGSHSLSLTIGGTPSYTVYYSTSEVLDDSSYSDGTTVPPARKSAGVTRVSYYVKDEIGYYGSCAGSVELTILPKVTAEPWMAAYDGMPHSANVTVEGGATLYYSTQMPLTFENYMSGSTETPTRVAEGITQVYYIGVPNADATESSCVSGMTSITVETHAHDNTYTIETAPTLSTQGSLCGICGICGQTVTIPLPALNRTDYDCAVLTVPTCLQTGMERYTWRTTAYGVYSFDAELPKLGHDLIEHEGKEPSCTEDGWAAYQTCTRCDYTTYEALPKLGHAYHYGVCAVCDAEDPGFIPFEDVRERNRFFYEHVYWAVENGITKGTTETTFSPNDPCTRGHVVTFLWRAAGAPEPKTQINPFADVRETAFYYKAVLWAVENGVTNGISASSFGPTETCTRGQVVTFLWRALGAPEPKSSCNPFTDVRKSAFYFSAVLWAVENGITKGTTETSFSPQRDCTRGQVVTFLHRSRP